MQYENTPVSQNIEDRRGQGGGLGVGGGGLGVTPNRLFCGPSSANACGR